MCSTRRMHACAWALPLKGGLSARKRHRGVLGSTRLPVHKEETPRCLRQHKAPSKCALAASIGDLQVGVHASASLRHTDTGLCMPSRKIDAQTNTMPGWKSWFLQSLNIHKLARQQHHKASGQLQQLQPLQGHWYRTLQCCCQWCFGVLPRLTPLHGCNPWGSRLAKRAPAAEGGGLPTQNVQGLHDCLWCT